MLVIFAVIIGGIIAGRLLSSWRLVFAVSYTHLTLPTIA